MNEWHARAPAGWYADPDAGDGVMRWWDGLDWTDDTRRPGDDPASSTRPEPLPSVLWYDEFVARHVESAVARLEADPGCRAADRMWRAFGLVIGGVLGLLAWPLYPIQVPVASIVGAIIGWWIGPSIRRWSAEHAATKAAHEDFIGAWAQARGWTYERRPRTQWSDVPFLRQGGYQSSEECLGGELWPGTHGHIYNFTFAEDPTDITSYRRFMVLRVEARLGIPQLQIRPRKLAASRLVDPVKGGVASRRAVRLESDEFERRFVLEVDDKADEIRVRTLFDPILISHCIDTCQSFPQVQANHEALVFIRDGHLNARDHDVLAEVDEFIDAVRPTVDRMVFNVRHFGAADGGLIGSDRARRSGRPRG